ncbi:hypothetical protein ACFOEK_12130 [Litoribrevibacter euphylliae]|uniref:PD(D/E)XK endonuclease domain-containing protein n=1 Tax=Litoribrevibacter euphylliae TaxID=1834034 RepID=A0ABV7HGP1_9GAMM
MPVQSVKPIPESKKHYKSISYETLCASWLLSAGWEVFMPMIDHGMKTDVLISDGNKFYRIQVKSVESYKEDVRVTSSWEHAEIDYVIYFSRLSNWGFICPPFKGSRKLNNREHLRFHQESRNFIKVFNNA